MVNGLHPRRRPSGLPGLGSLDRCTLLASGDASLSPACGMAWCIGSHFQLVAAIIEGLNCATQVAQLELIGLICNSGKGFERMAL